MAEKRGREDGKGFVWKSLRISFWVMVILFVIPFIIGLMGISTLSLPLWVQYSVSIPSYLSIFFTFIISIIHLIKYKKKSFAIVALVISSLMILLIIFALLMVSMISSLGNMEGLGQ